MTSTRARDLSVAGGTLTSVAKDRPYSVVSLYSGAGGMDLGFDQAGFDLTWAIDSDARAVDTYRANLGHHAVCGSLPIDGPPADARPDVVIGGPPCQGFSVIGRMSPGDDRSEHVFHYLDVVERLQPSAFVMENVKALATAPRWRLVREALIVRARSLGYETTLLVLNAAHYGVPQARERMFLIGIRHGLRSLPSP